MRLPAISKKRALNVQQKATPSAEISPVCTSKMDKN
jgi:hypothetical protein